MAWNPLQKKPSLCVKPSLSQGLSTHMEDRELEMCFNNLQNLEDNCKKLYKEDKKKFTDKKSNEPIDLTTDTKPDQDPVKNSTQIS